MCRWMAYLGDSIPLESLLLDEKHNLIDQSMSSQSPDTATNGDGFGVGWYAKPSQPGLFRSIRPAWNDFNLRDLATHVESRLFLAHVRATSLATVQETNCHPFRYGNWLFVHNGEIFEIEKFRRELILAVDPKLFNNIQGSTDSELMFHLALTFGLEDDPPAALARMAAFVEQTGRAAGVDESLWMTLGISDGRRIWAVRYASDGQAPTLYHSRDVEELYTMYPALKGLFGQSARCIVSEPTGEVDEWIPVPQGSLLVIHEQGEVELRPFAPCL